MSVFKTEFYKVEVAPKGKSLDSLLSGIMTIIPIANRNEIFNGVPYRLQDLNVVGNEVSGDMVKIRMDMQPVKASLHGPVQEIQLARDEGIGEETAFIYRSDLKVLAIQRNRVGTWAYRLADYIEQKSAAGTVVDFLPLMSRAALKRINGAREVRWIQFRIAGSSHQQAGSVGEVLKAMKYVDAQMATVKLSMGHAKGGLLMKAFHGLVSDLRRIYSPSIEGVKDIRALIREHDDEPPTVVDLIKSLMLHQQALNSGGRGHLGFPVRIDMVRKALHAHEVEIKSII